METDTARIVAEPAGVGKEQASAAYQQKNQPFANALQKAANPAIYQVNGGICGFCSECVPKLNFNIIGTGL